MSAWLCRFLLFRATAGCADDDRAGGQKRKRFVLGRDRPPQARVVVWVCVGLARPFPL